MSKRFKHPRQGTDEAQAVPAQTAPSESRYDIEPYGHSRSRAFYEGKDLRVVTVYR